MPAQKFRTKRVSITDAIAIGTTTISHNLGRVARVVTFKDSGQEISFDWNDKSGSTSQIDVDSLAAYGAIEINIIAY